VNRPLNWVPILVGALIAMDVATVITLWPNEPRAMTQKGAADIPSVGRLKDIVPSLTWAEPERSVRLQEPMLEQARREVAADKRP
jgi:hypothetical protein